MIPASRATRIIRPDPPAYSKWCLEEIIDSNGNYIKFSYVKDQGQIYPDRVDYTGNINNGASPTSYLIFYRTPRSTSNAYEVYYTRFRIKTAYNLKAIAIFGNGAKFRAYNFGYYSTKSRKTLLTSVTEYDSNANVDSSGNITGASLPPLTMQYSSEGSSLFAKDNVINVFNVPNSGMNFGDFDGNSAVDLLHIGSAAKAQLANGNDLNAPTDWGAMDMKFGSYTYDHYRFADFDGDRKSDYLFIDTGYLKVARNNGSVFSSALTWGQLGNGDPARYRVADFDGDGKADVLFLGTTTVDGTLQVAKSAGASFPALPTWGRIGIGDNGVGDVNRYLYGDFDGDGKVDVLYICYNGDLSVALSNGASFDSPKNWGHIGNGAPTNYIIGDFNGDGNADILYVGAYGVLSISFSSGSDFIAQPTFTFGNGNPPDYRSYDFNGDGKSDLLYISGCNNQQVGLSTGASFLTPTSWGTSSTSPCNDTRYNHYLDLNGDGKTDVFSFWYDCQQYLNGVCLLYAYPMLMSYNGQNSKEDLLVGISNGIRGRTAISYVLQKDYLTQKGIGPLYVVDKIASCDNYDLDLARCMGLSSETKYDYANAYFYVADSDFRGFNYARVTGPKGPNNEQTISESWFHQGNETGIIPENASPSDLQALANVQAGYMKGKPYRRRISGIEDGQQLTYSEVETVYADLSAGGYYYNPPQSVHNYSCGGGVPGACKGDGRHSETVYGYDPYGNVTREVQYGDESDTSDDRTVIRTFAYNQDAWIMGLPASESIYPGSYPEGSDPSGDPIASTTYYYDGDANCSTQASSQSPTLGNLSRVVRWLKDGTSPESWMGYDPYGNLQCSRDANSILKNHKSTRVNYDTTFTFPTIITNPLDQQTVTRYYGVDGVATDNGLYGQVASVTDPNNATTTNLYDRFGRQTKTLRPDNTWTSWSYNNFGVIHPRLQYTQNIRSDTSAGTWSIDYLDGLGRTYKNRSSGPESKTIVVDTQYDGRGKITRSSLPYFEGIDTKKYVSYTYDPLGRTIQATNFQAPNERTLTCFYEGATVTIDPNNHVKRQSTDVYGRLTKVEEYTGTQATCTQSPGNLYATTTYQYDVLGNLTSVKDNKDNQTTIFYDTLGRKISMTDPDMGTWYYEYDGNGNLRLQTDANNQKIKFGYDPLNRLITKDYGADNTSEITFTYDEPGQNSYPIGRLTTMSDLSGTTKYFYDKLGRTIKTQKSVDGTTYTYSATYDDLDRVATLSYPHYEGINDETVVYQYDKGNMTTVTGNIYDYYTHAPLGSTTYAAYTGYNALGQPKTLTFGNGVTTNYSYNDTTNYRLNTIKTTAPGPIPLVDLTYFYYDKGNIRQIADAINSASPVLENAHSYSPQQDKAHAFGITGSSFLYDRNGNLVVDGSRVIAYDFDNMPAIINSDENQTSFVYDGNGNRVKKITTYNAATYTTTYIDKVFECTSGNPCGKYIFAGDKRIALSNRNGVFYYHTDHLGSTIAVTDVSGAPVENEFYTPFGDGTGRVFHQFSGVKHTYTGQELDGETGLYNYNARLYSPEIGRFITADSIVPDPTNPQSLNRYSYVLNNPMIYTDPTGHGNFFDDLGDQLLGLFFDVLGQFGLRFNLNDRGDYNASLSDIRNPFSNNQYIFASSHGTTGWDFGGGNNYYQYLTFLGFSGSEYDQTNREVGKTLFVDEIMDTDFYLEAKKAPVLPHVHTFFAHGGVDYMNEHHYGKPTVSWRARDVTRFLKTLPEYDTIDTVVYSSCHSGEGPNSLAALSSKIIPDKTFVGADSPVMREYGPVYGVNTKSLIIPFWSGKWNYYKDGKLIWSY